MTGTMVRTFEHLAQTGVDVLVVAGTLEARRGTAASSTVCTL